MANSNIEIMRKKFYEILSNRDLKQNNFLFSAEKIARLIFEVKESKERQKKVSRDYWLLKHYDILNVDGAEKLIFPLSDASDTIKYYCASDELFDILHECHTSIGHGGRDRMVKELCRRFKNITQRDVQTFVNICGPCQQKKSGMKKGLVVKPLISRALNSRCQIDLIDYQSQPDKEYKFIFVYQDHLTNFVILRPLVSKRADEVVMKVLEAFTLLGPLPKYPQTIS